MVPATTPVRAITPTVTSASAAIAAPITAAIIRMRNACSAEAVGVEGQQWHTHQENKNQ
jgi:hypothetical protein